MTPATAPRRLRAAIWSLAFVGLLGLLVAACGSDSTSTSSGSAASAADLDGTDWVLDGGASDPEIVDGQPVTISFTESTVDGAAPCNAYGGTLSVEGSNVQITEVRTTLRACEPPVDQAETDFFAALEAVDAASISEGGRQLVLSGDGVELAFGTFDASQVIVGEWFVVNYSTPDALTGPLAGTQPTITLTADGQVSIDTGCNGVSTTWELDGDELTTGVPRQTMMACSEPAGIMEQEAALAAALEEAHTVQVTTEALMILRADGTITLIAVSEDAES